MSEATLLRLSQLAAMIEALRADGRRVLAPVVRDGSLVIEEIAALADLPAGWGDRQDPGRYRLEKRPDAALFGHAVGPHAWKRILWPPSQPILVATRKEGRLAFRAADPDGDGRPMALLGVRPCDLAAIGILGRAVAHGPMADPGYAARREAAIVIAVSCTRPGGTCFCASMGTGPRASGGFDVALTEIADPDRHRFVAEAGSDAGRHLLDRVGAKPASDDDAGVASRLVEEAAACMGRALETDGLREILSRAAESREWDGPAGRCLACANCTLVCPTCFCTDVEDRIDLTGARSERTRVWDSCFTSRFTYLHGGAVRASVKSRYRQWLTHKLSSWHDQFGTSGCVGCGRCITWCPAGIDLTEVAAAMRSAAPASAAGPRE